MRRALTEGQPAARRVTDGAAPGEDVARRGRVARLDLFGLSQPGAPSTEPTAVSRTASTAAAMPRSMTFGPSSGQQHVVRLQVAVHEPVVVDLDQGIRQGHREGELTLRRERSGTRHEVGQRRPVDVLDRHPGLLGLGVEVEEGDRVGPCTRNDACTSRRKRSPELRVVTELRPDHLERDLPVPSFGQVDDAHAADAEPAEDPELTDGAGDRRRAGRSTLVPPVCCYRGQRREPWARVADTIERRTRLM